MRPEVTRIAYWQLSNAKQSLQVARSSVKIRIIALNSNVDQSCLPSPVISYSVRHD